MAKSKMTAAKYGEAHLHPNTWEVEEGDLKPWHLAYKVHSRTMRSTHRETLF